MPRKTKSQVRKAASALFGMEMLEVEAKNEHQKEALEAFARGNNVCMTGSAGTGKTFLALWMALDSVRRGEASHIVIIRSAVQTRDIGALPGTIEEKGEPFLLPYFDMVNKVFGRGDAFHILQNKEVIEFTTTSFLRGITIDNAIVIIDEAQNDDAHELVSILTRLGYGSRFILCGDSLQSDLIARDYGRHTRGYVGILKVLHELKTVDQVVFDVDDIVRSGFVREFLTELQRTTVKLTE